MCSLDTHEYTDAYPRQEWGYLRKGVLIDSSQAGLIHYVEPEQTLELIERSRGE
ncbi:MAG TPA: hypothetical protein VE964_18065 [Myxococcales bacterium]|nr:hypothetical protein [Myxococcales bacterium]